MMATWRKHPRRLRLVPSSQGPPRLGAKGDAECVNPPFCLPCSPASSPIASLIQWKEPRLWSLTDLSWNPRTDSYHSVISDLRFCFLFSIMGLMIPSAMLDIPLAPADSPSTLLHPALCPRDWILWIISIGSFVLLLPGVFGQGRPSWEEGRRKKPGYLSPSFSLPSGR